MQESDGFQADRLSAGIRTGDDQNVFFASQCQIQRDHLFVLFAQGLGQKRMAGILQEDGALLFDNRHCAVVVECKTGLGPDQIHGGQVLSGVGYAGQFGAQHVRKTDQYPNHFTPLLILQLFEFVIDLNHLDRLNIDCFAGGRFIVDKPFDLAFVGGIDRDDGPSFTDRDRGVGIDQAGGLSLRHDLLQAAVNLAFTFMDGPADCIKFRRGAVFDLAETVDD